MTPVLTAVNPHAADSYRSLFDHSGMAMASLDRRLCVREANIDFCRQIGRRPESLIGRSVLRVVHHSHHAQLLRQFARLVQGTRTRLTERVTVAMADDQLVPAELTATSAAGAERILVVLHLDRVADRLAAPGESRKVLTELDAKILEGVAAGISSVQLAAKLCLSRQGVEYHVSVMLRRLRAPNRAALVSRAYSMGVLNVGAWPPKVQPEFVK